MAGQARKIRARAHGVACLGLLLAACGASSPGGPDGGVLDVDGGDGTFIALQRDFADFQSWTRFDVGSLPEDGLHVEGSRVVYLNRPPPHGSTQFPVGTILVKTVDGFGPDAGQTFAMAKRGGDYNFLGATDWEWFELQAASDGTPVLVWRGVTPPEGEGYGGVAGGACNRCHAATRENDHVLSEQLSLSRF